MVNLLISGPLRADCAVVPCIGDKNNRLHTRWSLQMRFGTLQRLKEIQDNVSSQLTERGLSAKLTRRDREFQIVFENGDGTVRCPVEIVLDDRAIHEGSWEGSILVHYLWDHIPIGKTGWTLNKPFYGTDDHFFDDDVDQIFATLGRAIEDTDLVYHGKATPGQTDDENFANAYEEIRAALFLVTTRIECSRDDSVDSYNFLDQNQAKWRVAFVGKNALISVNDEVVASIPANDSYKIGSFIDDQMARIREDSYASSYTQSGP
jgi:hypothetical protein